MVNFLSPRRWQGVLLALLGIGLTASTLKISPFRFTVIGDARQQILAGSASMIAGGLLYSGFTWKWFSKTVRTTFNNRWLGACAVGVGILVALNTVTPIDLTNLAMGSLASIALTLTGVRKGIVNVLIRRRK